MTTEAWLMSRLNSASCSQELEQQGGLELLQGVANSSISVDVCLEAFQHGVGHLLITQHGKYAV